MSPSPKNTSTFAPDAQGRLRRSPSGIISGLFDRFLWLYWRSNKRFLAAFAETLIGQAEGDLHPDGREIVARVERTLREMPRSVFRQVILTVWILPVSVPAAVSHSRIRRLQMRIRYLLRTHTARVRFLAKSPEQRIEHVNTLFSRLADQAIAEENDLIKSIVVLNMIKSLLVGTYLEIDRTWTGIGYSPFPTPSFDPPSGPDLHKPQRTKASALLHANVKSVAEVARKPPGTTTYCVVGSGAGGATVAEEISRLDPNARVVLLEAGPLVPNDEMPLHLMDAVSRLYMNGGTTLTQNQKYILRQARCVGGGTVVNNSVALKPEGFWWQDNLVRRWSSLGVKLDWNELYRRYDQVGEAINVAPLDDRVITPMARTVRDGFKIAHPDARLNVVTCNLLNCIGCGRCNLGCQYGAKQSMLETTIPRLIESGGSLVPDAHVTHINFDPAGDGRRVRSISVSSNGAAVEVEGDRFVLAAGCYASTKLLWRSGFTGAREGIRTVGKRFSGNFGTPVIGRMPSIQRGWNGQQVGYVVEVPEERLVIESAFGPPAALGWMARQWGKPLMEALKAYDKLAVAVPVLGTIAYGEIRRNSVTGFSIDFKMIEEDWRRLTIGMRMSAEALLAMGAEEIYTTRFDAKTMRAGESLDDFLAATGPLQYLDIETAHLQGGNVIHPDPNQGVVDTNMKVHGVDNLWIADASVIPSPITLNVQMTVMALAAYAAPRVVVG